MKKLSFVFAVVTLTIGFVPICCGQDAAALRKHFDYDQSAPLGIHLEGNRQQNGATVQQLTYAGAAGGIVPATLVVPAGKGPFAAILWGHWMRPGSPYMNRSEFLEEAVALSHSGVVSLLIDAPMVRPGSHLSDDPNYFVQSFHQDVIDLRRGIDLLTGRSDVDVHRVGYVGHSFHADTGAVLAGVEPSVDAFVLMAANIDSDRILVSQSKDAVELRKQISEGDLRQFLTSHPWMNPAKFLSHDKHAPLLLQFGTHDTYMTKEDCEEYAAVVSAPSEVRYYDTGHELNAAARHDRIEWLQQKLALKSVDWKTVDAVTPIK